MGLIPEFRTVDDLWFTALNQLVNESAWKDLNLKSRAGKTWETLGYVARLQNPQANFLIHPSRNLSPIYAAGEFMWYMSGSDSGDHICAYAPQYRRFLDHGSAYGAYGKRWDNHNQLKELYVILSDEPNTRQAVISMWEGKDLKNTDRYEDIPCTICLQFLIRRNYLHCFCTMRSNDIWLGMPYDIFCFTTLQCLLADYLRVGVGEYQHQVGSLHIYERDLKKAEKTIEFGPMGGRTLNFVHNPTSRSFIQSVNIAAEMEAKLRLLRIQKFTLDFKTIFGSNSRWSFLLALCALNFLKPLEAGSELEHQFGEYIPTEIFNRAVNWQVILDKRKNKFVKYPAIEEANRLANKELKLSPSYYRKKEK